MTLEDELLTIERALWTGGPDAYRQHVAEECLVVFPEMTGVFDRDSLADTVSAGPRWEEPGLDVEGLARPTEGVALLTYRAEAERDGERHLALVSSGFVRRSSGWKLYFHQQTPL